MPGKIPVEDCTVDPPILYHAECEHEVQIIIAHISAGLKYTREPGMICLGCIKQNAEQEGGLDVFFQQKAEA